MVFDHLADRRPEAYGLAGVGAARAAPDGYATAVAAAAAAAAAR
jgi:hypothetical protein